MFQPLRLLAVPGLIVLLAPPLRAAPAAERATSRTVAPATDLAVEYTVGAGDVLSVNIRAGVGEATDLRLTVAGDGTVNVVHLGAVKVAGLTTPQISSLLERRLREGQIYTAPHVSVNVEEYLSQGVNVTGMVKQQGRYYLKGPTRLVDVIAQAEGIDEAEADDTIRITRAGVNDPILISRKALFGPDPEAARQANVLVQSGDNIHVVPLTKIEKTLFCITGPVGKPDCHDFEGTLTLAEAISKAGDLDGLKADRHKITVRRTVGDRPQEFVLDLDKAGEEGPGFKIRSKDQIIVAEAQLAVTVGGLVKEPGEVPWHSGLTISDAIAARGGVTADSTSGVGGIL